MPNARAAANHHPAKKHARPVTSGLNLGIVNVCEHCIYAVALEMMLCGHKRSSLKPTFSFSAGLLH